MSIRVERKRAQARNDILETALARLKAGGLAAVTVAGIAADLGMTKPAIYHYFSSKEALVRELIASLLSEEIDTLLAAVNECPSGREVLGAMIHAFHRHYRGRLSDFRLIYAQPQLIQRDSLGVESGTLKQVVHPRTRVLFERLEERLADATEKQDGLAVRRLAFSAWTSALGLMSMLSLADAMDDPLAHSDEALLETLAETFDRMVESLQLPEQRVASPGS